MVYYYFCSCNWCYIYEYSAGGLNIYVFTHSMQHSPSWEANLFSASQEIPRILWNPKIHYHIQSARHLSLSSASLIQSMTPSFHFLKTQINIILPSTSGSPKWSLSLRFPYQNPVYASPLLHRCSTPHQSHSSRFYYPNNIGWVVEIIKLLLM